jgi:AraC-like DNA-binding protein
MSIKAPDRQERRTPKVVPAAHLRLLMEIVQERGVHPEQVLAGTGLSSEGLAQADGRIPTLQAARVCWQACQLTRDPGLGLAFGLRCQPTVHGYLGYGVMACATLQEAVDLTMRFTGLIQPSVAIRCVRSAPGIGSSSTASASLVFEQTDDLGFMRRFLFEAWAVGIARAGGFLTGRHLMDCTICFDWPEPDYFARYRDLLPPVRFGMPRIQICFDEALLATRIAMAEPGAVRLCAAHCERELALVGPCAGDTVQRVRQQLRIGDHGYLDLSGVAGMLCLSPRTLKRHLQQGGSSFQALLDEARHRDAMRLLQDAALDIQSIATLLGYDNPPSFTRAFRRWTGETPSQAREEMARRKARQTA